MTQRPRDQNSMLSYLKAQSHVNPSLAFDEKKSILSDASAASRWSALEAKCRGDEGFATHFASYVGPGALSALLVNSMEGSEPEAVDHGSSAPGIWLSDVEAAADNAERESSKIQLELDDIVWRESLSSNSQSSFGAGVVLLLKICGALTAHYNPKTIAHVGKLVRKNTMTAVLDAANSENGVLAERDPDQKVAQLLSALLDQSKPKKRSVHMNSNEPVLLINNAGSVGEVEFGTIVTETVEQLQRQWNIWPVRVYAGRFMESHEADFSISLLNVTNTDIGGPSMIQLLDAPCEARGWLGYARREVWNGRELLEKEERQQQKPSTTGVATAATVIKSEEEAIQVEAEQVPVPAQSINVLETLDLKQNADEATETDPEEIVPKQMVEAEPSEIEEDDTPEDIRQRFKPAETSIEHPTWTHRSESISLLDLIRSQSSALYKDPGGERAESKGVDVPKSTQPSGSGSDEEFVVV